MEKILLVEDSDEIQDLIKEVLEGWFECRFASSLAEARASLERESFDLIVLDIHLPDGNGLPFLRSIRDHERTKTMPVIILTGHDYSVEKVLAFSIGADDYVLKPFDPFELRARIQARIRRRYIGGARSQFVQRGPLRMDVDWYRAYLTEDGRERELALTPVEFKVLLALVQSNGEILKRDQLMAMVWPESTFVAEDNVYTHICALRKKLGSLRGAIQSIPRVGYFFRLPGAESESA